MGNASNSSGKKFKLAMNKFADLHVSEFKAQYVKGVKRNLKKSNNVKIFDTTNMADSIDWTTRGAVTPVKDQGQCGSCWAFSAISSTETANWVKTGTLTSFSEQQLVDCAGAYGNLGCNGGLMDSAFEYIQAHGIDTEAAYPYTARDGTCKSTSQAGTVSTYTDVQSGSVEQLKA